MIAETKGIVLKTLAYGDTSLIATVFTEGFGMQKYLIKGARKVSKKGASQQVYYQPGAILDMVVYHRESKNFEIVKEVKWHFIYQNTFTHISRHTVLLYMVELLASCLKQPETNKDLYAFAHNQLLMLDEANADVVALLPSWFTLHLGEWLGFGLDVTDDPQEAIDVFQGAGAGATLSFWIQPPLALYIRQMAAMENAVMLYRLKLNRAQRKELLQVCLQYFLFHHSETGTLKSLPILKMIME